ncbi:hypothetical protein SAMD00019534_022930 [Acytostelium subglobosum LB1]|uniref:hypothetical protein n=1 Tax=Acytostelium subglobosum LB1 TaxID=1410327 RepID=UPI000644FB0D|nr:hypothetical protein SAMD00019534_022930 [Acytostelium subglobosum LB1]GAM19118.1 hypothetical protein SAMD00019534_022930 [Acytostelium subglobosum LB1]|eukprot:XP_012757045.1 hypothetical protein SAMD00019534_022930 [Acytostelium subglobosum LB1]
MIQDYLEHYLEHSIYMPISSSLTHLEYNYKSGQQQPTRQAYQSLLTRPQFNQCIANSLTSLSTNIVFFDHCAQSLNMPNAMQLLRMLSLSIHELDTRPSDPTLNKHYANLLGQLTTLCPKLESLDVHCELVDIDLFETVNMDSIDESVDRLAFTRLFSRLFKNSNDHLVNLTIEDTVRTDGSLTEYLHYYHQHLFDHISTTMPSLGSLSLIIYKDRNVLKGRSTPFYQSIQRYLEANHTLNTFKLCHRPSKELKPLIKYYLQESTLEELILVERNCKLRLNLLSIVKRPIKSLTVTLKKKYMMLVSDLDNILASLNNVDNLTVSMTITN